MSEFIQCSVVQLVELVNAGERILLLLLESRVVTFLASTVFVPTDIVIAWSNYIIYIGVVLSVSSRPT
jgi:hypothetical protein